MSVPMPKVLFRHGDVLLQATAQPAGTLLGTLRRQSHLTLAYGEVTGHSHRIAEPHAAVLFTPPNGTDQFLNVTAEQATLIHEEHGPIQLPAGWYRVWQQREYIPGSVRRVLD